LVIAVLVADIALFGFQSGALLIDLNCFSEAFGPSIHLNRNKESIVSLHPFDKVLMNVGFYYMANAGGCLTGTVLSGWIYQVHGLEGCLWWSAGLVLAAAVLSFRLPEVPDSKPEAAVV